MKTGDDIIGEKRITENQAKKVAEGLLLDFKELPGFKNAQVSAMQPIYDIADRKKVAYYELKFSSPERKHNGYAIISATTADYPVVEFSEKGLSHYERFRKLTRGKPFQMVRFGPQYITAEDSKGELLAEIGWRPVIVPEKLKRHIRMEGKGESGPVKLPEELDVDLEAVVLEFQDLDYKAFKLKFAKPTLNIQGIQEAWEHALKTRDNSECVYEYYWADGINNRPKYSQIPKNTPPNNTGHVSGCGPTAWMNIYGWHDLNWRPELLKGSQTTNNTYIENLTMDVHDHLGTSGMFGEGFTTPGNMVKGYDFALKYLDHDCSYFYRHDWWWTDENWVFEVARDVIRAKRPFIVGYYQDWHYTIGYGVAECKTHGWESHSWIQIYKPDKWIPKGTIFGIYGVYNFFPILEFYGIENPQELDVAIYDPGDANRMFIYTGTAVFNFRGTGGSWKHGSISFEVGRYFEPGRFRKAIVTASLASISNDDTAVNAGWAVDRVDVKRSSSGKMKITAKLAVRDVDGYLQRMAYKVTVLARIPPYTVE